ncbi:unnamed protein product [Durusdinium trenchii]|uniref:Peptidyl-prolyl cis-trans isomerase n=1 Tax=Durusdinium trenchii TaxID=1381693 RepID=A0ABP0HZ99_9DINO
MSGQSQQLKIRSMLRRSPEKLYIQTLHGPSIHGEVITRTIEEATYQVKEFRKTLEAKATPKERQAEFERLARKESDCGSAREGGSLGKFGRGQMQKPFEDAAFALEVNELSHVVNTDSGVHIILRLE